MVHTPLKSESKVLLLKLVAFKVAFLGLCLIYVVSFPGRFNTTNYFANFHWPQESQPTLWDRFLTWDGQHYIFLSQKGYQAGQSSNAFYPLWPWIIKAFTLPILYPPAATAIALSNIMSIVAIFALYRLLVIDYPAEIVSKTILLMLAFPGSMFLHFAYSESLFLLLVVLFFLTLRTNRLIPLLIISFLLPLTRAIGIFAVFVLILHFVEKRRFLDLSLAVTASLCGCIAYFTFVYWSTGNPFEGFRAQSMYVSDASVLKIFDIWGFINALFTKVHFHGFLDSSIDRLFFVVFLVAVPFMQKLPRAFLLYAVIAAGVPAMTHHLMSFTRYLSVVFPLFLAAALYFERPTIRRYYEWVMLILILLQIFFVESYLNNEWAG
jgi:hypothetical protein